MSKSDDDCIEGLSEALRAVRAGKIEDPDVREHEEDLIEGLTEAIRYMRGEISLKTVVFDVPDVKAIRQGIGMSQEEFADAYKIPLATLKNWEQRRRHPDAPTCAFLYAIEALPKEIAAALSGYVHRATLEGEEARWENVKARGRRGGKLKAAE